MLVYQFPQGPGSLRVKVWRRLQSIGAVAIKNSMYVLPPSEQSREDFQWLLQELGAAGADGAILEVRLVDGLSDTDVQALFNAARGEDYAALAAELEAGLAEEASGQRQLLSRGRRKLADIEAIDFFGAPGRDDVERLLRELNERLASPADATTGGQPAMQQHDTGTLQNRVWVTRRNVRVDRIASAWLIRTRIDAGATFRFTADRDYRPQKGELRFDMYDGEFTHDGDRCTFEVLLERIGNEDPAMQAVAEVVHDIDLKDRKYGRPEAEGVAHLLDGLAAGVQDDELRIAQGGEFFENLYRYYTARTR